MLRRPRPHPRGLSSPRVARQTNQLRPAQRQCFIIAKNFKKSYLPRQSPFARKALCTTGRAWPLACAAAAVYPAIHKSRPAAAQHIKLIFF